jgi:hypothetical protein
MQEACGALQGSWPLGDGKSPGGLLQVRKVVVSLVVPARAPRRLVTPGSIVRVAQWQSEGLTTLDAGSNPAADFGGCFVVAFQSWHTTASPTLKYRKAEGATPAKRPPTKESGAARRRDGDFF